MSVSKFKDWASSVRKNTYALYLAARHPGVPLAAKVMIGMVVGYALSPIDLIPDFIPLLGYLDDLLLLPLGIWIAIRMIPRDVWNACLAAAQEQETALPESRKAAVVIVLIWLLSIGLCVHWMWPVLKSFGEN